MGARSKRRVASIAAALITASGVAAACGGRVAIESTDAPPPPYNASNTNQPDPPPPTPSFVPFDASADPYGPKPHPPLYADASVAADGSVACLARPTLECKHCENCDFFIDTQATFNALIGRCGRICGDIVVDFDGDGCALRVAADAEQFGFEANLACILTELQTGRWSCGYNTSAWASFGHYCGK